MRWLAALLLLLTMSARGAGPAPCPQYDAHPKRTGRVPPVLRELSGFAASHRHAGIFWAHNDSGNPRELYALRADGTIAVTVPLRGVNLRDPEDIALGPCAAGSAQSCIYLADIGDNGARRPSVQILKAVEPERLDDTPLAPAILPFRYPDGPHNAEALIVDPATARVFVITKTLLSLGDVYRIDDLGGREGGTAVRIRTLRATAADAHPSGTRLLLRTYTRAWELRSPDARAFEDVLDAEPVPVPEASQPQGEAIAYTADGRGYLLGGEGVGSPLYLVSCAAP